MSPGTGEQIKSPHMRTCTHTDTHIHTHRDTHTYTHTKTPTNTWISFCLIFFSVCLCVRLLWLIILWAKQSQSWGVQLFTLAKNYSSWVRWLFTLPHGGVGRATRPPPEYSDSSLPLAVCNLIAPGIRKGLECMQAGRPGKRVPSSCRGPSPCWVTAFQCRHLGEEHPPFCKYPLTSAL